jgi:hypothetical protein
MTGYIAMEWRPVQIVSANRGVILAQTMGCSVMVRRDVMKKVIPVPVVVTPAGLTLGVMNRVVNVWGVWKMKIAMMGHTAMERRVAAVECVSTPGTPARLILPAMRKLKAVTRYQQLPPR